MPWTGPVFSRTNGTHTGSTTWAQDAAAGDKILSTRHDTHDQDIADGINSCLKKDGGNSPTANIPMNNHKFTGMAVGVSSTDSARFGQTITAASLDSGTNVLTLTRADGDITVDLTAIVVGGSFGNLCDKTVNETISGLWTFQGEQVFTGFLSLYSGTLKWIFDGNDTDLRILQEAFGPGLHIDVTTEGLFFVDSSGVEYGVWSAINFDPADKSDVGHSHTLTELIGVAAREPVDGDVLQWQAASNGWVNAPLAAISGVVRTVTATAPLSNTGTATDVVIACTPATTSVSGLMSAADKTKLDALSSTQVTTFNSRSGAVVPASADYTIQQIANVYVQNIAPAYSLGGIWIKSGSPHRLYAGIGGSWVQISADF